MSEELNKATENLSLDAQAPATEAPATETSTDNAQSTVLDSKKEFNVKHPLNSKWTLWYTKPANNPKESWSDLLKPVITFSSVEEFWGIFNSIPQAGELPLKADYHLFRENIKPEWEDPENSKGGKWNFQFKNKDININELWLRTLLSVIGETIEDDDNEVNGAVLNVRKVAIRISLWTKSSDRAKLFPIGMKFRKVLKLSDADSLEFLSHKDADNRSAKPLLTV
ncbi:Eukaryotic translation initiation factor 4E [Wickerhamomyces ciferrii]|uniref:Eukaryotic translation initiation factor 4E n=1 Tax=Wickerhamomyces ciferrii (strain ATCC 14091 / BCRC 22168 / CBS 111 / JCM 3599 / NBRC 0793 / NRRL Y-1031 F-60-10) TaxID=1206466 RepID=K0KKG0_WICCF|nr:Eukaryotic translation initiation factor 4E [Wickerhamomyces ciferrii]CCH43451.1 Eukaryotic translation initiation factor 4E [Wickerhamomyces ciferrii]